MWKAWAVLALLILCVPAIPAEDSKRWDVEATTKIGLPVDSVTIYPDGLVAIRRLGVMNMTEGVHNFVVDVPSSAVIDSLLLIVSNSSVERVVYDNTPTYTLKVMTTGPQTVYESYLLNNAGSWQPKYSLHLDNDSMTMTAVANVKNRFDESLKDVRLKLVTSLSEDTYTATASMVARAAPKALEMAMEAAPEPAFNSYEGATGKAETLYVFEVQNHTDLDMGKEIGLPLFEVLVPIKRIYVWDAASSYEGPVMQEIRANNTAEHPWPSGRAFLYKSGDYVAEVSFPYTQQGANASLNLGPSSEIKVSKKMLSYNSSEQIVTVPGKDGNGSIKVKTENFTYQLDLKNLAKDPLFAEVRDNRPMKSEIVSFNPTPSETTATTMKWNLNITPGKEIKIEYTYRLVETESLGSVLISQKQQQ